VNTENTAESHLSEKGASEKCVNKSEEFRSTKKRRGLLTGKENSNWYVCLSERKYILGMELETLN
jgi:hypothetical protein